MKTLIIAEAGVNHNGDLAIAREMIQAAATAGADLVKFQSFLPDDLVSKHAEKAEYQKATTGSSETQLEMLRRLVLSAEDHRQLVDECRKAGIGFFSTAFDVVSLDFLLSLGITHIKIPSGEVTNLPLLRFIARRGLPTLVSTGMCNLGDIEAALEVLESGGLPRDLITVLHCTTEYPAPMSDVNLSAMTSLRRAFQVGVGYSDHTLGYEVSVAAVALGARVIEKHFTLDRNLPGPDHRASLEPSELSAMVKSIRNIETAMGDGIKRPTERELRNRAVARRSLVAAVRIAEGEAFTADNLTAKRPGTGISPMRWDEVLGRRASRDFEPDEVIEL